MLAPDLIKSEEESLAKWEREHTRERVNTFNKEGKPYFFLEGPPYANGELHLGHARGYSRKDAILRFWRMNGRNVFDRAGFDVHGLPTENRVERDLGIKSKREIETGIGVGEFVKACTAAYRTYMKDQIEVAMRYGVWMDFANAYIPAAPDYIEKSFGVFKKIYDKKLVYRGTQVMPYCVHCGTVLAKGPEVEEEDDTDPSIYVLYKVNKELSKPKIELGGGAYLLAWTTTPWTIPGNMLVAVNPTAMYVRASINGREMIVAKDRLDAIAKDFGLSPIVLSEFLGSELDGIYYTNPLEKEVPRQKGFRKYHKVVMSEELVSMAEGSGLLHVAPAYGPEDFALAKSLRAPMLSLVGTDGKYTVDAGKYAGVALIHDANREVEKDLEANGALLAKTQLTHSYPHCWRCHEKLVYLPTEQWFVNVAKMKKRIIRECDRIEWHPPELKRMFLDSIRDAPDWVVSRQRYWGIPMPIWVCDSCGNRKVIGSLDELEQGEGRKVHRTEEDLHKPFIDEITFKCGKCGGTMHRVPDIFDVWYDSGVAHTASLSSDEFTAMYGKSFVTEGPDQIRGWFATLMKTGVAAYNKTPFNTIMLHGWVTDSKGFAMHKSKHNYVGAKDLIGKYPVDAVRLYLTRFVTHENIKFSETGIEEMQGVLMLMHNMANMINEYASVVGYTPKRVKTPRNLEGLDPEDAWIVSRLNSAIAEATEGFDGYETHKSVNAIVDFAVNDLSRFYLKIAKKKIVGSAKGRARKTLDIVNYALFNLILAMAPLAPMNMESIYLRLYHYKESVFMERWPKARQGLIGKELEKDFDVATESITALLNSREKAGIRLRWPVVSATLELSSEDAFATAQKLSGLIEDYTNSNKLVVKEVEGLSEAVIPVFKKLGPDFKENANAVADALRKADAAELRSEIESHGHFALHTGAGTFTIGPEHFATEKRAEESDAVLFKYGKAYVDTARDEAVVEDATLREFERNVQLMRKELGLKRIDRIELYYDTSAQLAGLLQRSTKRLAASLNAKNVVNGIPEGQQAKEFDVMDTPVKVFVRAQAR
ncbi:isoleucine--tRNA ligase [Candidatus Marsarchaeota archaeon]|nr:isoleucine--tRNA ligase [Candidatus Marsarchaeota archaeon]MCL5100032.1 isoleucine--tRNA ligase [Candidatus Marsarchaeota archaeon]